MPSKSPAQKRLMQAAAHTKGGFGGVPQSVGKEFVIADKRTNMKKAKKMADGGMAGLGNMVSSTSPGFGSMATGNMPMPIPGSLGGGGGGGFGGGGGSAQSGLNDIGRGAGTISQAINQAASRLTGGGGGGGGGGGLLSPAYKKGGSVTTTRRVSTGSSSKKSNW